MIDFDDLLQLFVVDLHLKQSKTCGKEIVELIDILLHEKLAIDSQQLMLVSIDYAFHHFYLFLLGVLIEIDITLLLPIETNLL